MYLPNTILQTIKKNILVQFSNIQSLTIYVYSPLKFEFCDVLGLFCDQFCFQKYLDAGGEVI